MTTGFVNNETMAALNAYVWAPAAPAVPATEPAKPVPPASASQGLPLCTTTVSFSSTLALNSTDVQVRPLQQLLLCLGYFPTDVTPTGRYGAVTEKAIGDFQRAAGLAPSGVVDAPTAAALNKYVMPAP